MGRKLEDWLDGYLDYTEESESPYTYRLWVGISVMAAALERKCYLPWGQLEFFPNMYVLLVGPSGCRKGTAMNPGLKMLQSLGTIKLAAQSTTRQALIRRLQAANNSTIDIASGTIDAHCSLTIFSEEFTVFLGYQNLELMADLCDWFDCKQEWTYETKNMGTNDITGVWVNLIGATTPTLVRSTLPKDSIGGGLTSRIIFVYEDGRGKVQPFPRLNKKLEDILKLDLEDIHLIRGKFRPTEEVIEFWGEWYHNAAKNPTFTEEKFGGYEQRRAMHIIKLGMILSASRGDSKTIELKDIERSIGYIELTEKKMRYTYDGYGASNKAEIIQQVILFIAQRGKVVMAELMQHFYQDADKWMMDQVLDTLSSMKYIRTVNDKETGLLFIEWVGKKDFSDRARSMLGG